MGYIDCNMVGFWAPATVPDRFQGRKFYPHNPNITLMRTTPEENRELGWIIAEKLNLSTGPVTFVYPHGGWSMIDAPGQPFCWPEADEAFLKSLKEYLRPDVPLVELDCNVNDAGFARRCAETLLTMMEQAK